MKAMSKSIFFHSIAIVTGVLLIAVFHRTTTFKPKAAFLVPPAELPHFTFGYNENVADSLWLRLIQDIDHCDADDISGEARKEPCTVDRGWVFHMLDAITTVAPRFRAPYAFGATVLSVLIGDKKGAAIIFDRGLEQYPGDWTFAYKAGYHALIELNDRGKAAELLLRAGKNGAPQWVIALAARLYTEEGRKALATSILKGFLDEHPDDRWAERIRSRLNEIESPPPATKTQ